MASPPPQPPHLSELAVDLAELDQREALEPQVWAHLSSCTACQARVAEAAAAREALGSSGRPERVAREVLRSRSRWAAWLSLPAVAIPALAALALWLVPTGDRSLHEAIRLKGDPVAVILLKEGNEVRSLGVGERLAAGARVQLAFRGALPGHQLTAFVIDGCAPGVVYEQAVSEGEGVLPVAFEVDGVTDDRVALAFGTRRVTVRMLEEALRAAPIDCRLDEDRMLRGDGFTAHLRVLRASGR